ncbi:unnamed protein product [Lasius platythorax]|uniref:Uncharacterized protein n=1 Tax=Lasius platythorax TaxID=488582 RepID=A0AAV2NRA2_9HYME
MVISDGAAYPTSYCVVDSIDRERFIDGAPRVYCSGEPLLFAVQSTFPASSQTNELELKVYNAASKAIDQSGSAQADRSLFRFSKTFEHSSSFTTLVK